MSALSCGQTSRCGSRAGCSRAGRRHTSGCPSPNGAPGPLSAATTVRGARPVDDPAPQGLADVRGDRVHRPLVPVEGHRVEAGLGHPERRVELDPQRVGLALEPVGQLGLATSPGEPGDPALRVVHVALHLRQRDRRVRRPAGPVADGVGRVLPALVDEPEVGPAAVLDEPVAVEVAVAIDPRQSRQDVRPEPLDERVVARPVVGLAEQDQPQRRRRRRCRNTSRTAARPCAPSRRCGPRGGSCRARRRSAGRRPSTGGRRGPRAWPRRAQAGTRSIRRPR